MTLFLLLNILKIFFLLAFKGNDPGVSLMQQTGELIFPRHKFYHDELLPYNPLMAWLKSSNLVIFNGLSKVCLFACQNVLCNLKAKKLCSDVDAWLLKIIHVTLLFV